MRKYLGIWFIFLNISSFGQKTGTNQISVFLKPIALLQIDSFSGLSDIEMNFSNTTEAGESIINPISDSSLWLNHSSAVETGKTRRIEVNLQSVLPSVKIKVQAAAASGDGAGIKGTPIGTLVLDVTPQPLITNIGGAFTGRGPGKGFKLTYSIEVSDYSMLVSGTNSVTVSYTMMDN